MATKEKMAEKLFEYQKGLDSLTIYETYLEYGILKTIVPIKQITRIYGGEWWAALCISTTGSDYSPQILSFAPKDVKEQAKQIILKLL